MVALVIGAGNPVEIAPPTTLAHDMLTPAVRVSAGMVGRRKPVGGRMTGIAYRPEIDGLRALAVLPIVLFHVGAEWIPGGFVGVDVFFVISGYLITAICLKEIGEGRFSLAGFYRRRAVRILPALLVMLALVLAYATWRFLPQRMEVVANTVRAAALFLGNFQFWRSVHYFGEPAETRMLLHTWSLGVEEQFYLLYPLVLLALARWWRRVLVPLVVLGIVLSFGAAWGFTRVDPMFGLPRFQWGNTPFYLLPFRAWELLIGASVALGAWPALAQWARRALAALGLVLIVASFFVIDEYSPFPAPWALLPVMGTALVIAYGEAGPVQRLLSVAPLRWIGLISYSLYLWHWPVIAAYRLETGVNLDLRDTAILALASLGLAVLSYRFVERPFLDRYRKARPVIVIPVALAASLALAACAHAVAAKSDDIRPLPPEIERVAAYDRYVGRAEHSLQTRRECIWDRFTDQDAGAPGYCRAVSDTKPNLLLFGDSHAGQFYHALVEHLPGQNVVQATSAGCLPLPDPDGRPHCRPFVDTVRSELLGDQRVSQVVMGGRWNAETLPQLAASIREFVAAGHAVTVLGPVIEYEGSLPELYAQTQISRGEDRMESFRDLSRGPLNRAVAEVATKAGARFVDLQALQCPQDACLALAPDGAPMQYDYGHLTLAGARWLVPQLGLEPR